MSTGCRVNEEPAMVDRQVLEALIFEPVVAAPAVTHDQGRGQTWVRVPFAPPNIALHLAPPNIALHLT